MKQPKTILKILILLLFSLIIFRPSPVKAAGAVMKISPVATEVYIKAGKAQNYQFTLENTGDEDFSFKLYTGPYNVTNENYDADLSSETSYNQIQRWITFQDDSGSFVREPTLSLKAGEKRNIIYRVSVPEGFPEGGQYCVIYAESVSDGDSGNDNLSVGLDSHSRVSLIILGHGHGNTENIAEITDFSLTKFFTMGNIEADTKVKNSGNTDFLTSYQLEVKTLFGKTIYSYKDNFAVLPETERKFKTSWGDTPLFGIYRVKFSVEALDVTREGTSIVMIMPAFMIIIVLFLLTSIIVWTIMLIRKRKERSSRLVV
ncbi:hypothetical protein IKF63_00325 [Candidatus Saccharibacteria bacterium]|nr:hypothetical protein [Candidatus Saccharibacteria bacterium]